MKSKYILLTALAAAALGIGSCSEEVVGVAEEYLPTPTLSFKQIQVSETSIYTGYEGTDYYISVSSNGVPWQITDIPEWMTVTPTSGGGEGEQYTDVCITTKTNNSTTEERIATLSLESTASDWVWSSPIVLTQSVAQEYFKFLNAISSNIGIEGGQVRIEYETNVPKSKLAARAFFVNNANIDDVEVTATIEDTYILVNVPYNTYGAEREIGVQMDNIDGYYLDAVTYFYQDGAAVTNSSITNTYYVVASGGEYELTFDCNDQWFIHCDDSWISFNPESGEAGTGCKTIMTVLPNSSTSYRTSSTIGIRPMGSAGTWQAFKVQQNGLEFYFGTTNKYNNIPAVGAEYEEIIKSSAKWSVKEISSDDIEVSPMSGEAGETSVHVKIGPNPSTVSRNETVTFQIDGTESTITMYLAQMGGREGISDSYIYPPASGREDEVSLFVLGNERWVASIEDGSWLTVSPSSGVGPAVVKVTTLLNTQTSSRQQDVTFTLPSQGKQLASLRVYQYGASCSMSATGDANVTWSGSITTTINYSATVEPKYTFTPEADWITVTPELGSDNTWESAKIRLSYAENNTPETRSTVMTLGPAQWSDMVNGDFATSSKAVRINITQTGRNLTTSATAVGFVSSGGDATPLRITADGKWSATVTEGNSWITATADTDLNIVRVSATGNNTGAVRTGNIRLQLEGLSSGSKVIDIPVTQFTADSSIEFGPGFGDDQDWNYKSIDNTTIQIKRIK